MSDVMGGHAGLSLGRPQNLSSWKIFHDHSVSSRKSNPFYSLAAVGKSGEFEYLANDILRSRWVRDPHEYVDLSLF